MLSFGVSRALYGLIQYLTGWADFHYVKTLPLEEATGTDINTQPFRWFFGK